MSGAIQEGGDEAMASVSMLHPLRDHFSSITPTHRTGEGTPLVLLHGANLSWRAWRPVLPFLAGRHDVFVPTMAGHRGGPALPSGAGIPALVDVLCDQLDEAGIETAHLAGNSLGGWVALELARRGRARSVVAISPAGSWRNSRDIRRLTWMSRMARIAIDSGAFDVLAANAALRWTVLSRMAEHPDRIPAEDLGGMLADAAECGALGEILGGAAEFRRLESFDVALCPVRIAWAERDRTIPYHRYGRPMQDVVRGAEFVLLPGVGHVPMFDDPRMVARSIVEVTAAVDEPRVVERVARRHSA